MIFITEKLELDEKVKTFSTPEPPSGTQGTTWVKKGEVKEADVVSEKKREESQSPTPVIEFINKEFQRSIQ